MYFEYRSQDQEILKKLKMKFIRYFLLLDYYLLDAFAYAIVKTKDNVYLKIRDLGRWEIHEAIEPHKKFFNEYMESEDLKLSINYQAQNISIPPSLENSVDSEAKEIENLEELIWILDKSNKDDCDLRTIQNLLLRNEKLQYKKESIDKLKCFNRSGIHFRDSYLYKEFRNYLKKEAKGTVPGQRDTKTTYDAPKNSYLIEIISQFQRYYLEEKVIPAYNIIKEMMSLQGNISIYDLRSLISQNLDITIENFRDHFKKTNELKFIETLDRIKNQRVFWEFKNHIWHKYESVFFYQYIVKKNVCLVGQIEKKAYLDYINRIKSKQNL